VSIDPKVLDGYVGRYELAPEFIIAITREGGRLFAQATGQQKVEPFAEDARRFFLKVVDALTFESGAGGKAGRLILHQNGIDQPARRLE
jgi:D-alanyl-D-alanine-carboxypeptidase/D-alanyl-D-alanine-endopeptidase